MLSNSEEQAPKSQSLDATATYEKTASGPLRDPKVVGETVTKQMREIPRFPNGAFHYFEIGMGQGGSRQAFSDYAKQRNVQKGRKESVIKLLQAQDRSRGIPTIDYWVGGEFYKPKRKTGPARSSTKRFEIRADGLVPKSNTTNREGKKLLHFTFLEAATTFFQALNQDLREDRKDVDSCTEVLGNDIDQTLLWRFETLEPYPALQAMLQRDARSMERFATVHYHALFATNFAHRELSSMIRESLYVLHASITYYGLLYFLME